MECNHSKSAEAKTKRLVAGLEFTTTAKRCEECEATLWSKENETEFQAWLGKQKKSHRDRFVIQKVQIPVELVYFASELAKSHYTTESDVYQAALACYFMFVPSKEGWKDVLDSEEYNTDGPSVGKKIQTNPSLFLMIESNAKLFDIPNNAVAAWAISRVLKAAKMGHDARAVVETTLMAG
ncbi:MAG: hypothetical protein M3Q07_07435 [Pseudobdellovibrionaceae bacterium]|nr:hypothetical protein [Pseudobdellovibrionaceae bacterium]